MIKFFVVFLKRSIIPKKIYINIYKNIYAYSYKINYEELGSMWGLNKKIIHN